MEKSTPRKYTATEIVDELRTLGLRVVLNAPLERYQIMETGGSDRSVLGVLATSMGGGARVDVLYDGDTSDERMVLDRLDLIDDLEDSGIPYKEFIDRESAGGVHGGVRSAKVTLRETAVSTARKLLELTERLEDIKGK